ncbi:MAG: hypothetical protein ACC707_03125 [Thiohalomonadales bacterium]
MKITIIYKILTGIIVALMTTSIVDAIENPPYHLSRLGLMSIRDNTADNQQIIGVTLGMRVSFSYYVEAELNLPVGGGNYDSNGTPRNYAMSTLAIYSAYRYMIRPEYYLKLKLGLAYSRTAISGDNLSDDIVSKSTSGTGGLGFGIVYHTNNLPIMLELEVTTIDQGEVFLYSVGVTYPF